MASDDRLRELEERYQGYKVYDNAGERIGKVDDLFVDEADREEYIGVKMGFFGLNSTLIPMEIVRVDERERAMEIAESKDHVKDAPTFDDDDDITPEFEDRIRRHFGLGSAEPSAGRGSYGRYAGAAAGGGATGATSAGGGTEGRTGRESYRDRENLGHSEPTTDPAGTGVAAPSGGLRDLETGDRDRMRDEGLREGGGHRDEEGFREGGGRSELGDRADLGRGEYGDREDPGLSSSVTGGGRSELGDREDLGGRGEHGDREGFGPSSGTTGGGRSEEGMTRPDLDEPGSRGRMEDESYREGFREGFREGLRVGGGHDQPGDQGDLGGRGEPGDRGGAGASGAAAGAGRSEGGMARPDLDEPGGWGRVGDEGFREGGRRDQEMGAARPGDEPREAPRRSDEDEQEIGGLTRVWRRIRS